MDLSTWREEVRKRVQASADALRTLAPNTLYGFVAGCTLLPLVAAVNQGEYGALVTLAGIAGGIGGNLIANQVQGWKDKSDAELAADLEARAADSAEWREALDAVIQKIETPQMVQAALGEADRTWFEATLRAELGRLGTLHRYEIVLSGSGAAAVGTGNTVAGQGGVAVRGDVHGGVKVENNFFPPPAEPKAAEQAKVLQRYLEHLRRQCNVLPLASLGGEEGTSDEVTLDKVYIALNTMTRVPLTEGEKEDRRRLPGREEDRPLTALEAATQNQRLVLLGDPGSGKSTFARQLVALLSSATLGGTEPPAGWERELLPVMVNLRDLRPLLAAVELDGQAAERRDQALVDALWRQWRSTLDEFRCGAMLDLLAERLDDGRVFLVFDGLDEVPEALRPAVRLALRALLRTYGKIRRVLLTSRTRSYTPAAALGGFVQQTLAPFDEDQVRDFITAWYRAQVQLGRLPGARAEEQAADLREAARTANLRELAANPLLLTTMAIVHQREVGLPRERVRLYALAVGVLLDRWQRHKGIGVSPRLAEVLKDERKLRTVLERVAYDAHRQLHTQPPRPADGPGQGDLVQGDLLRRDLLALLEQPAYLGDAGLASEFLDYVDQRAGLLIGRGGSDGSDGLDGTAQPQSYAFPHRTFQEYLAGCYLLAGRGVARTYREHAAEGDYWYLAGQLGAEELLYNRRRPEELLDMMYALCPAAEPRTAADWRAVAWCGQMATLPDPHEIEADTGHADGGAVFLQRLIPRLLHVMQRDDLLPLERAEAGRALGRLGDPRLEVLDPLKIEWCDVPAGPFQMGGEELFNLEISYPFKISRFPVTNAQYAAFVREGGYAQAPYWREAAAANWWKEGMFEGMFDSSPRAEPYKYGEPYGLPNHPAVGVTWYEALAFARWLTDHMRAHGCLAEGWHVTLPSEAEWEKAARGADGREYPWVGKLTPNHANYDQTGIGTTNAVGCFAQGASPYQVEEMSGNVWEWTRSVWADYRYDTSDGRERLDAGDKEPRVLRGGSFINNVLRVRCGARDWNGPYGRGNLIGFRVVLSPLPLGSDASGR